MVANKVFPGQTVQQFVPPRTNTAIELHWRAFQVQSGGVLVCLCPTNL